MTGEQVSFPQAAQWIGSAHAFDLQEAYLDFRAPIVVLDEVPRAAELLITADSRYRLWINGRLAARGRPAPIPGSKVSPAGRHALQIETLAVEVYQPGYSHLAYTRRGGFARLPVRWLTLLVAI
jgi:hypothetical protein